MEAPRQSQYRRGSWEFYILETSKPTRSDTVFKQCHSLVTDQAFKSTSGVLGDILIQTTTPATCCMAQGIGLTRQARRKNSGQRKAGVGWTWVSGGGLKHPRSSECLLYTLEKEGRLLCTCESRMPVYLIESGIGFVVKQSSGCNQMGMRERKL